MTPDAGEESPGKSLYAVLNVSPTASTEEIRKAYRALAQTYHPDKQPTAELPAGAAAQFSTIQNAHEVGALTSLLISESVAADLSLPLRCLQILLDPEKRRVYDVYGEDGLQAGLQVSTFVQDKQDLQAEWQRFKLRQVCSTSLPEQDEVS